ncbi:MAG TPA: response regulator [Geobacteraceae bacterium]|nr:response regulator [Geobacteraceae bacterium]
MEAHSSPPERTSFLYVEDDPVTRDIMTKIIRMRLPQIDLFTAENGEAGLELYKRHTPDLVITDVSMPVMDGISMAAEIRALNPRAVIIVISAYSNTEYLIDSIEIGVCHYVLKPIDFEKFFATIDKCLTGFHH